MNNIEEIEVSLNQIKMQIAKTNKIINLHNNPDFNEIIVEGYFKEYTEDLVRSLADPQIANNEAKRQEVLRTLEGISCLHGYLNSVYQKGKYAKMQLNEHEQELQRQRNEAASGL